MGYTDEHNYTPGDGHILPMVIPGRNAHARRERIYYCIGLAILTPFAIMASLAVFLMCLFGEFGGGRFSAAQFPALIAAFLSLMWMVLLFNQMKRYQEHGANLSALGHSFWGIALLGLLAAVPLQQLWPTIFGIVFA